MREHSGKSIVLVSPEAWGKSFVSKHHYARYLSKEHKVYFINPAIGFSLLQFLHFKVQLKQLSENLTLVTYKNPLPRLSDLPGFVQKLLFIFIAGKLRKRLKLSQPDIVWNFDPFRFWNWANWNTPVKIYHTVDVHFNSNFEPEIAKGADIVLATTEVLIEPLKKYNQSVFKIRHGADTDNFKLAIPVKELPGKNVIKAGLVGNFNDNVDYDLIIQCAKVNPTVDFCFVGPFEKNNLSGNNNNRNKVAELEKHPNVFFLGEVPSADIMGYLMRFDINLVLYKEDKRNIIISPHKLMGYFYSGKSIVCSLIPEYINADPELLYMCNENRLIPEKIKEVVEGLSLFNSNEKQLMRKGFAIQNSYDLQIAKVFELIATKK